MFYRLLFLGYGLLCCNILRLIDIEINVFFVLLVNGYVDILNIK